MGGRNSDSLRETVEQLKRKYIFLQNKLVNIDMNIEDIITNNLRYADNYNDLLTLPDPKPDELVYVKDSQGIRFFNYKGSGIYRYNADTGTWLEDDTDVFTQLDSIMSELVSIQTNLNNKLESETDPVFQASEASNFVTGDKIKLDNQSGINTGDETTTTIQSKRPLKTIEGKSIEGDGNIDLFAVDVGLGNVDNTSDLDKPISNATKNYVDSKYSYFPIWAEESGGLSNNNAQWSYGNGDTGTIGIPIPLECELFAVTFNADTIGTSVSINFRKYLTTVHNQLFDTFVNKSQSIQLTTPIQYNFGDVFTVQTGAETGNFNSARVCAWFRVPL